MRNDTEFCVTVENIVENREGQNVVALTSQLAATFVCYKEKLRVVFLVTKKQHVVCTGCRLLVGKNDRVFVIVETFSENGECENVFT